MVTQFTVEDLNSLAISSNPQKNLIAQSIFEKEYDSNCLAFLDRVLVEDVKIFSNANCVLGTFCIGAASTPASIAIKFPSLLSYQQQELEWETFFYEETISKRIQRKSSCPSSFEFVYLSRPMAVFPIVQKNCVKLFPCFDQTVNREKLINTVSSINITKMPIAIKKYYDGKTLYRFMEDEKNPIESTLIQTMFLLFDLYYNCQVSHNDCHSQNVLVVKTKDESISVNIKGQTYRIQTNSYKAILIDFGISNSVYGKDSVFREGYRDAGINAYRLNPIRDLVCFFNIPGVSDDLGPIYDIFCSIVEIKENSFSFKTTWSFEEISAKLIDSTKTLYRSIFETYETQQTTLEQNRHKNIELEPWFHTVVKTTSNISLKTEITSVGILQTSIEDTKVFLGEQFDEIWKLQIDETFYNKLSHLLSLIDRLREIIVKYQSEKQQGLNSELEVNFLTRCHGDLTSLLQFLDQIVLKMQRKIKRVKTMGEFTLSSWTLMLMFYNQHCLKVSNE